MADLQVNLAGREGIPCALPVAVARALEPATIGRVVIGYNHQIPHRGRVYHVQTEDSGRDKGHIFTHVFHSGAIVASSRVEYGEAVLDVEITELLKRSHKSMLRKLVRGVLDEAIARCLAPRRAALEREVPPPAPRGEREVVDECREPEPSPRRARLEGCSEKVLSLERQLQKVSESLDMENINTVLESLTGNVVGSLAAALVDYESGMCLGSVGNGINIDVAAAGNMEVMKAKTRVMEDLGIDGGIEDILITLESQYHIIRPVGSSLFLYLAFDRQLGNLALARHRMVAAAGEIKI